MNAFLVSVGNISKSSQATSKCNQGDFENVSQYQQSYSLSVVSEFWVFCYLHFAPESIKQLVES